MDHKLIATPSRTSAIMKQYDIKMKKSLGQNFLVEPQILQRLVEVAEIDSETTVIEIGPGIGALTEFLALSAKKVLAFEIDQRFVNILQDTLSPYNNVEVIHQDILKVDFSQSDYAYLQQSRRLVVVANLPYYITTPIIMHLLASQLPFDSLVMMMQKEVAERMTAKVGTKAYNSLTVAIQLQMKAKLAFIVPPTVFIPRPNVDSAVLKLTRLENPSHSFKNSDSFQQFVQACFKQRRKTLWNNLKAYYPDQETTYLESCFTKADIVPSRRAETLNLDEFIKLFNTLNEKN
ncbi:16S rRNA (adenine(1518)-N(6)/adenine(1519)-N(6))-dimethyltransferase RsmA [Facklamia sp. 7083-14-GEN3]|nr:16S rRNA (adenine(1518)-N(6)/adenine(1519)-N(6))-dimethyltransferase RsmA [Facklamia sp. 7083-14-GEN3]MCR8969665.1 16S rRNA (adenine(1518)-N(6)/adenine(1519)-N(6))-dimethyltransferase RsmA [Facklamia sp. 7083-14-GEN3]